MSFTRRALHIFLTVVHKTNENKQSQRLCVRLVFSILKEIGKSHIRNLGKFVRIQKPDFTNIYVNTIKHVNR